MKKISIFLVIVLIATSCQLSSDSDLISNIETKIKNNPTNIDLINIQNLDYDKLLILEPYSNIEKIEIELNVDLSNIKDNQIYRSDAINLIVFLKNNKSIKIAEINRRNGDFADYKTLINRDKAVFYKSEKNIITLIK